MGSYDFYNNHRGWCDLPYPEIDLTYDSASPFATVLGDIAVSLVVLLFALILLLLLPRTYIGWWNNWASSFLKKTIALVEFLITAKRDAAGAKRFFRKAA